MEEHVAYSSPDWDGKLEDGAIKDEGTQGWCITTLGESIIHADEPVEIWSVKKSNSRICMRFVDQVPYGMLAMN